MKNLNDNQAILNANETNETKYSYQQEIAYKASKILQKLHIVILTAEMRTGKSYIFPKICKLLGYKKTLVITKKSAIVDVEKAIKMSALNAVCINYEQIHNLKEKNFDAFVIDEAHSLGAIPKPSLRTKRLQELIKDKPVIFLSGTITPENYAQIYSILSISNHSPFSHFRNFYQFGAYYFNFPVKYIGEKAVKVYIKGELKTDKNKLFWEIVNKYCVSLTQSQAGFQITDVNENIVYVEPPEYLKNICDEVIKYSYYKDNNVEIIVKYASAAHNKLHQICSGTILTENVLDNGVRIERKNILSEYKMHKVMELAVGKSVIFYKYRAEYDLISNYLKKRNVKYTQDHIEFNETDTHIYLKQIQSGGVGINLQTAKNIIYFNITYSASYYLQSKMRANHRDRTEPVNVYYVFSTLGFEDIVYKAVAIDKINFTYEYYKTHRSLNEKRDRFREKADKFLQKAQSNCLPPSVDGTGQTRLFH